MLKRIIVSESVFPDNCEQELIEEVVLVNEPGVVSIIGFGTDYIKYWHAFGFECITRLAGIYDAVNGYVRIPETHPDYGKSYDSISAAVHGGLTYSDECGWYGFDTLHAGDFWPGMDVYPDGIIRNFRYYSNQPNTINWTQELVEQETERLALWFAGRV